MLYYNIHPDILGFTTDREIGRDKSLLYKELLRNGGLQKPLKEDYFCYPHQTHTDRVMQVASEFFLLPEPVRKALLEGVDAIVSQAKNAVIGISTADCIPVLVYDPVHAAAAAIHAGWRGTVRRIVEKSIDEMHIAYGTNPADCIAVIGPGISIESFEVGDEVHSAFMEERLLPNPSYGEEENETLARMEAKWHINLKEINKRQLLRTGLKAENISVSDIDTFTNPNYFSARREQKDTTVKCGRMLTGFVIK